MACALDNFLQASCTDYLNNTIALVFGTSLLNEIKRGGRPTTPLVSLSLNPNPCPSTYACVMVVLDGFWQRIALAGLAVTMASGFQFQGLA